MRTPRPRERAVGALATALPTALALAGAVAAWGCTGASHDGTSSARSHGRGGATSRSAVTVRHAAALDTSPPLGQLMQLAEHPPEMRGGGQQRSTRLAPPDDGAGPAEGAAGQSGARRPARASTPAVASPPNGASAPERAGAAVHDIAQGGAPPPRRPVAPGGADVEQRAHGGEASAQLVASFDGIGASFVGPQGAATLRNPSDNSLAVGPNHVVQVVNTRMAVFTKRGTRYDTTGRPLYGPVPTNNLFRGFGGPCEEKNNGDAVVRYDQLAHRWLVVMPIFSRVRKDERHAPPPRAGEGARASEVGQRGQPGVAQVLRQPPPSPPGAAQQGPPPAATPAPVTTPPAARPDTQGVYAMCYAVSTSDDPLGRYYRYEFIRPLFPDYPRPAVWPDGYYIPTSTGDDVIQKHACVAERARMLAGAPASEQCVVIDGVNFLNNADLDGTALPPRGAPNIMLAAGGTQLHKDVDDDGIYAWTFAVDWQDPSRTKVAGPVKVAVAPYHYLCDGQLTSCVPQPGTERRLDAQGDKLMARVVYRRIGARESIVAVHSVNTSAGGGGVRWYEFRVGPRRALQLYQQGTFAPDSSYRWMASPAMDRAGNIGIGYSFGGTPHFAGQRFAARRARDPRGMLTLREHVLVEGGGAQENTLRWQDYTQTAIDPSDDCTIWYVGDYLRAGDANYSTRIGGYRLPGCDAPRHRGR